MSFGSLSANAILALNKGARAGDFAHDTGEGSISRYHREHGGDLIWEVAAVISAAATTTAPSTRSASPRRPSMPQVKMIEIKLSPGRQAGTRRHPAGRRRSPSRSRRRAACRRASTASRRRRIRPSRRRSSCCSSSTHLRELSGGKPTGFKLAVGHLWEWFAIAKAMLETGILPDFIVVDGGEGGTGAAPVEFTDHVGVPMREALMLVHNTLVGHQCPRPGSHRRSGQGHHGLRLARTIALGADWCNAARGFMFALGCVQSRPATRIPARPASRRRIHCDSERSSSPTRPSGCTTSIATR